MTISEALQSAQHRHDGEEPVIALLSEDIYVVLAAANTMGFVEKVGNVFVALSGPDLARAVEVGQSLSWDESVAMVRRSFGG